MDVVPTRLASAALLFLVSLSAACGGTSTGGGGADGGSGAGEDSGLAVTVDASVARPDSGATTCATAADCANNGYCERKGSCGLDGTRGICGPKPTACNDLYAPVCACDGKIYGNSCEANGKQQDVSSKGECPPPQGFFACGEMYCDVQGSYCQRTGNDAPSPGQPSVTYACIQLPPACMGKKDCSCFPSTTPCFSANQCKVIPSGPANTDVGFQITCLGG